MFCCLILEEKKKVAQSVKQPLVSEFLITSLKTKVRASKYKHLTIDWRDTADVVILVAPVCRPFSVTMVCCVLMTSTRHL